MDKKIENALKELKILLRDNGGNFILIGAVAANLLGADFETQDIDICGSKKDIEKLNALEGAFDFSGGEVAHIASNPFFRISTPFGLDYEFMGGIKIKENGTWRPLYFGKLIEVGGFIIPDFDSQIGILHQFGRPKDLQKIELLRTLAAAGKIRM